MSDVDAITIDTDTSSEGLGWTFQRKAFYAVGRHWVFYTYYTLATDVMSFKSSADGINWTARTDLEPAGFGESFSLCFDGSYFHYVRIETYGDPIYYRRGQPQANGTITWDAEVIAVAAEAAVTYWMPFIVTDSEGYPWISYDRKFTALRNGAQYFPYASKSSTKDGTWTTASGFPYRIVERGQGIADNLIIILTPLTNEKMYALVSSGGGGVDITNTVWGKLWDTTWGSEEETGMVNQNAYIFSAISIGDDVYAVYKPYNSPGEGYNLRFIKRVYGTGWGSTINIYYDSNRLPYVAPILSFRESDGLLFVLWKPNYGNSPIQWHVVYCVSFDDGVTWHYPYDWIDESTDKGGQYDSYMTTLYPEIGGNYFGCAYKTKQASPYNTRYAARHADNIQNYITRISRTEVLFDGKMDNTSYIYRNRNIENYFTIKGEVEVVSAEACDTTYESFCLGLTPSGGCMQEAIGNGHLVCGIAIMNLLGSLIIFGMGHEGVNMGRTDPVFISYDTPYYYILSRDDTWEVTFELYSDSEFTNLLFSGKIKDILTEDPFVFDEVYNYLIAIDGGGDTANPPGAFATKFYSRRIRIVV